MTQPLQAILHDFYESFFPYPSQFERREGLREQGSSRLVWVLVVGVFFGLGFAAVSFFAMCAVCNKHEILSS